MGAHAPSGGGGGGGGSPPVSAVYAGGNVSIADQGDDLLTWDFTNSDVDVLDTSDPAHPVALAAGTYIVSVWIQSVLTAGGFFQADLTLDPDTGIAEIKADSAPDPGQSLGLNVCVSAASFIPAGGEINLRVYNFDGAATRNFKLKNSTIVFFPS